MSTTRRTTEQKKAEVRTTFIKIIDDLMDEGEREDSIMETLQEQNEELQQEWHSLGQELYPTEEDNHPSEVQQNEIVARRNQLEVEISQVLTEYVESKKRLKSVLARIANFGSMLHDLASSFNI
jgi:chromosome segregation ATPase